MSISSQPRDAATQTSEDIFFDAPEELFEDALENQNDEEIRCIETHSYLANPDKGHYPDLPALFLQDEIQDFNYQDPAPFDVDDPEFEKLLLLEESLINLQEKYESSMKKEDGKFKHIMALYEKVINRPYDPSRLRTLESLKKERTPYVRRLNEITRLQELMDREYLVEFTEIKQQVVAIMDKWHAKQTSLAAVPHKLVVEENVRWTLLKQKQLEYIHDKTKDLVSEQANRIRRLEYALTVAQQATVATPYVYQQTASMAEGQALADAYMGMTQQQMNHGFQNAAQTDSHFGQFDNVGVPVNQEPLNAGENIAQVQQQYTFQNQGNPQLEADSGEDDAFTVVGSQTEALEEIKASETQKSWTFQYREPANLAADSEKSDETVSNFKTPNSEQEPIAAEANSSQGQERVDDNTQEVQQLANPLPTPPLNDAVPIVPDPQARQNSYVNFLEYDDDPGRMYALHSSDPIKKAWARKKLDVDFKKKQEDTVDRMMKMGRYEAAMKKWAETVSDMLEEVSPNRRPKKHIIQDFDENEEPDDDYGRKRTFGTYEEDDEGEEEHSRKRLRSISRIIRYTPTPSLVFEPTPEDSTDEETGEEPATGYIGHDGVYYEPDGRRHYVQNPVEQGYSNFYDSNGGHPVRQYTSPLPQQQSPCPPSTPASRIRSYFSRCTATRRTGSVPARLTRQRMLHSQWSQWQNNRTAPR
ncbi:hypothetical protein BofuT4_P078090.1 [Botrytis cinerea T4]|uniref:Uncharacterized protein n=1 Tax=Botryotinia fuckeliana (strain T4) TaxID=999810 RepID=G2YLL8_BOTF4|nr:hypothetical protein BofuT4_P078090.1 [Botrytis cinerea T4]